MIAITVLIELLAVFNFHTFSFNGKLKFKRSFREAFIESFGFQIYSPSLSNLMSQVTSNVFGSACFSFLVDTKYCYQSRQDSLGASKFLMHKILSSTSTECCRPRNLKEKNSTNNTNKKNKLENISKIYKRNYERRETIMKRESV